MNKRTITLKKNSNGQPAHQAPWLSIPHKHASSDVEKIHFSGANGFPVASYETFFNMLTPQFELSAMDSRGAWPQRQEPQKGFSMHSFADDLIDGISQQHHKPVIGMGHSHGGQVTLIAALKRPELFSKLVIIEPASLPSPYIDLIYRKLPKAMMHKFFPFIRGSEMRKKIWPSREAFIERYETHPTFKRFTQSAMTDYAKHGLFKREDGQFELVFDPIWESYIFRNIEFMWKFLRKTTLPTLVIRAQHSTLYSHAQFEQHNKYLATNIHPIEIPNTHHLLPQENPELLLNAINTWLKQV